MKLASSIFGLGLALLVVAGLGLVSGPIAMAGLVTTILGAVALAIALEEHDLAAQPAVEEAVVDGSQPTRSVAA